MLLVGMDGQSLMGGGMTGLGRYTQSLIDAFKEWEGEVRVKIYMPKGQVAQTGFKSSLERLKWEQFTLPQIAMRDQLDVFHTPCFSLPAVLKLPRVMTIHDLIITKRPRFMRGFSRYYFGKIIPWSAKYASHIITNSEATRRDVIKYCGIPSHKVTALLLAPTFKKDEIIPMEIANKLRSKFRIHWEYILYVGSFEPRKNIEVLLAQFKRVNDAYPEIRLLCVGGKSVYRDKLEIRAKNLGLKDKVVFTGYLDKKQLAVAYKESLMVVLPSMDEGFGLPIVEAMEMGKPVVASKIPAHIESAGGAAVLFDLPAELQLGDSMLKIISNYDYRNELIEKGNQRVKQLSWNQNARKTIEIYYMIVKAEREKRGIQKKKRGYG